MHACVSAVLAACSWTGDEAVARTLFADSVDTLPGRLRASEGFETAPFAEERRAFGGR
jgi:hypothetical protein